MAICALFIGRPRTGKTTEAIKYAECFGLRQIWANDVRREYKYRINKKITTFHGSSDGWLKLLNLHDFKGSRRVFISDEAGDYFPHGSKYAPVTKPVRGKAFNGNVYIIVFHSLSEVPDYVLRFTDVICLKKSRGNPNTIAKKYEAYPEVFDAFLKVNNDPDPYAMEWVWI